MAAPPSASPQQHGELRALDPHTGEKVASLRIGPSAFITPIAAGGIVYVLADNGELIAIR